MNAGFYFYLASNENNNLYLNNTNAIFKNSVNPPLSLEGEYECALVELITPTVDITSFKSSVVSSVENGDEIEIKNSELPSVMIIYSNIITASALGGSSFPILRIISTTFKEKSKNTTTSKVFSLPFYKKICTNYLSEIEVSINTQSGKPFPFPSGVSFAVLHVRPVIKNEY